MSRGEALASMLAVFLVALIVRIAAATVITFPRPEDVAYHIEVARNLLEGRGLTTGAIWSYGTPPLTFPRQAFEVWLPLPTFLAVIPMALLGHTFAAAQWSTIVVGSVVPVLAWRVAADIAEDRRLPVGRARTLALGTGLSVAVYLPLVLHAVQPDSTTPFAALALAACLLMTRLLRRPPTRASDGRLVALGLGLGLAALTRNEAIWIAFAWAIVAWLIARRTAAAAAREASRPGTYVGRTVGWLGLLAAPAIVSIVVFAPWAVRDWSAFGTPFPGQAVTNAFSLDGRDIFAWLDPPTLSRYLAAGPATLLGLRWAGLVHNVVNVLLLLGIPVSALGLVALPWTVAMPTTRGPGSGLLPLALVSAITFLATTLLFPVSTTWGTFLHAAGAIHVLLVISALLALDRLIAAAGRRRGWTRPVAWLGPAFTIAGSLLFLAVLLPAEGRSGSGVAARFRDLPARLAAVGVSVDPAGAPLISDTPIWVSEESGLRAIALPNESPENVLDLAHHFDAEVLLLDPANEGIWPEVLDTGGAAARCFEPVDFPQGGESSGSETTDGIDGALAPVTHIAVYRIVCR